MTAVTQQTKTPLLVIENLSKEFDGLVAVDNVNLQIEQGELFALLGSSGCGKSTLLRMLAGFEQPSAGRILLDGVDMSQVPPHKRPINMMFQSYALFPHMTVAQNIAFGLKQDRLPKAEINEMVDYMLGLVRMRDYAQRKPHQLSGGQKQRVALARSLAKKPKLLLLDEPLGALDKNLRKQMQLEVVDILEAVGATCVMVTHDQEEAMTMAGRIAIMDRGQFMQVGEPEEIYEYPNSRFSAEFLGEVNVFEGTLSAGDHEGSKVECEQLPQPLMLSTAEAAAPGVPFMVAVRPEKIRVSKQAPQQAYNNCSGKVEDIAYLGDQSIYYVRLPSGIRCTAIMPNSSRQRSNMPTWEDAVYLSWDSESCVVLKL